MIDLTDCDLFKDITSIRVGDRQYVDLHNDYSFINLDFNYSEKIARFIFKHRRDGKQVTVIFHEASIERFFINEEDRNDADTIALFYRGRFILNGTLLEKSEERG